MKNVVVISLLVLPDEMVQPILALLQEPRPEARDDTLTRKLRDAAVGVREGFDEILAKTVEFGVSIWVSVGMNITKWYHIVVDGMHCVNEPATRLIAMHIRPLHNTCK